MKLTPKIIKWYRDFFADIQDVCDHDFTEELDELFAGIEALEAENAALRADKARLDWMQYVWKFPYEITRTWYNNWIVKTEKPFGTRETSAGNTLRAAIDAAMEGEK